MPVRLAGSAGPGLWGNPQCRGDSREPLKHHQPGEETVGSPVNTILPLLKQLRGALRRDVVKGRISGYCLHSTLPFWHSASKREQPNTGVKHWVLSLLEIGRAHV